MKKVKGFENYQISTQGVLFDEMGKEVRVHRHKNGYFYWILKNNNGKLRQVRAYKVFYNTYGYSLFPRLPDLEGEIWKKVVNHSDYAVSNMGRAKKLVTETELSYCDNGKGYLRITMDSHHYYLHRVVGETFLRPIGKEEEIDHINAIKHDNRVENLRIVTCKENMNNPLTVKNLKKRHNFSTRHYHDGKWIYEKTIEGETICAWRSITDAADYYGVVNSAIGNCLRGRSSQSCGRRWEYVVISDSGDSSC